MSSRRTLEIKSASLFVGEKLAAAFFMSSFLGVKNVADYL